MNYLDTAVKAAMESGSVLMANLGNVNSVSLKAKNDLVTEVDFLSEKLIVDLIKSNHPDHSILAEEGGESDDVSEYRWLIDPIDGTMNYAHSYPFFSVSIALEYKGEIILGVVYDPVKKEMFSAESGKGACLNGKFIAPSRTYNLEDGLLATGILQTDENIVEANLVNFCNFMRDARGVRRDGSAALDLCYVACGRYDGFWELGLNPWDTAAGAFIVKESSGKVTNLTGGNFTVYKGEIVASNGLIHDQMIDHLVQGK